MLIQSSHFQTGGMTRCQQRVDSLVKIGRESTERKKYIFKINNIPQTYTIMLVIFFLHMTRERVYNANTYRCMGKKKPEYSLSPMQI